MRTGAEGVRELRRHGWQIRFYVFLAATVIFGILRLTDPHFASRRGPTLPIVLELAFIVLMIVSFIVWQVTARKNA